MPPTKCDGCGKDFESRNAIFRHLKESNGACLDAESHKDFHQYVLLQDRKKVLILYGYLILPEGHNFSNDNSWSNCIPNGQDAASKLLQTLEENCLPEGDEQPAIPKINRSYGNTGRNVESLLQDERTGAITEVLATKLPAKGTLKQWLDSVNTLLASKEYPMRVFGRLDMPHSKFNAEMDVTHRRVEYLLPADFLMTGQSSVTEFYESLPSFMDGFRNYGNNKASSIGAQLEALNEETVRPNEDTRTYLFKLKKIMQSFTTKIVEIESPSDALEKDFHKQKRMRQCFKAGQQQKDSVGESEQQPKEAAGGEKQDATKTVAEKGNGKKEGCREGRRALKARQKRGNNNKGTRVLQRKRFHNFTDSMMAHDYFSFRRMDRLYHRATLRFPDRVYEALQQQQHQSTTAAQTLDRNCPFLAISISGDLFLRGQVCRVVGVLIALARGLIDEDFIDCVFDEDYPHLIPTPEAPPFAMYASEAHYTQWEGKVRKVLTARKCHKNQEGWHDPETLRRVNEWQAITREEIAKVWLSNGVDSDGRLLAERDWTRDILEPWLVEARRHLEEYRQWKKSNQSDVKGNTIDDPATLPSSLPPLSSIDESIPVLYQKVLRCLRDADASGLWPTTTPKRQMVMISTPTDESKSDEAKKIPNMSTLSMAHWVARNNKKLERSSAYAFREGEGGASGTFSVGAMPGEQCVQPKANQLFPDLMMAAFELERALCPEREPSSTIAINRNTQFRPHTDSGAGAGQSTSLIVALGNFVGGELVVEGKREDIRYRAVEFNGWTQRHWTMPFQGERYSLVWFTPKGCEGIHGIDLCE